MLGKSIRGFSLLELTVAMFLLGLLSVVLAKVASTSYRIGHEELERSSVEAQVMWISKRLQADLSEASPAGISLAEDGSRVMVHPLAEPLGSGRVPFQESFLFWSHQPEGTSAPARLTRRTVASRPDGAAFDGSPVRWTTAQLMSLPGGSTEKSTHVAQGVTKFLVKNRSGLAPPLVSSLLEFELEAPVRLATTRTSVLWKASVQVRNGGT